MATELKTFRFDVDVLQRTRDICKRRGDLSYHINEALRQYIDKPIEIDLVIDKKPVVKKAVEVFVDNGAFRVIDYLNNKAGTQYRYVNSSRKLIDARLKEFTKQDMFEVISKKCDEWKGTEMARYLRPSTLFNATKFEEYLNQKIIEGNTNGTNRYSKPRKETALESMAREQKAMDAKREALRNNEPVLGENDSVISTQVYSG
jgi:uncharacterized phage protein (TIGR02220 family)